MPSALSSWPKVILLSLTSPIFFMIIGTFTLSLVPNAIGEGRIMLKDAALVTMEPPPPPPLLLPPPPPLEDVTVVVVVTVLVVVAVSETRKTDRLFTTAEIVLWVV